jgi:hypothetical protein
LAFFSEKTAGDGDAVIALLEDEPAGDARPVRQSFQTEFFVVIEDLLAGLAGDSELPT